MSDGSRKSRKSTDKKPVFTCGQCGKTQLFIPTKPCLSCEWITDGTVQYWPTPSVKGNYNRKGASPKSGDGLATAVNRVSPPSTSSPAGSPVRTSPSLVKVPGSKKGKGVVFGQSSTDLLASYDRATSSWRMLEGFCMDTMRQRSQMTDAYVAGLIDGEGCISIAKYRQQRNFSVRVEIGMSSKAMLLLKWVQEVYGGAIRLTRKKSEKWDAAYTWGVYGQKGSAFLRVIGPLLKLKQQNAKVALQLQAMIDRLPKRRNGNGKWSQEASKQGLKAWECMKELNQKGPTVQPADGVWVTPQQDLFDEHGWEPYSQTFPRSGTMRNGKLYRRPPSVRPIDETESSSWPTPRTRGLLGGSGSREMVKAMVERGELSEQEAVQMLNVKLWPTPSASQARSEGMIGMMRKKVESGEISREEAEEMIAGSLTPKRMKVWPTPRTTSSHGPGLHGQGGRDLQTAVAWPTPTKNPSRGLRIGEGEVRKRLEPTGGQLNADWVSLLMGFPATWTVVDGSVASPGSSKGKPTGSIGSNV